MPEAHRIRSDRTSSGAAPGDNPMRYYSRVRRWDRHSACPPAGTRCHQVLMPPNGCATRYWCHSTAVPALELRLLTDFWVKLGNFWRRHRLA